MDARRRRIVLLAMSLGMAAAHSALSAPIGISNTQALAFGKFASGTGGSVMVNAGGGRTATGAVVLLSSVPGSAAQFNVTGDPNLSYQITLPTNGFVTLSNGIGSMAVNNFVSIPGFTGMLSPGGNQLLRVGATLVVGNAQSQGSYTGNFLTMVEYN